MTELERVRDVEARLELAEEFHEAAERHIPALLQGLEERGLPLTKTAASALSPTPSPWSSGWRQGSR